MKRFVMVGVLAAIIAAVIAPSAQAAFGIEFFNLSFEDGSGSPDGNGAPSLQAGSHPFAVTTKFHFHTIPNDEYGEIPDASVKDLDTKLPAGLVGDPGAVPRCPNAQFLELDRAVVFGNKCPDSSVVGTITLETSGVNSLEKSFFHLPVYDLVPPPGAVQKLGFEPYGVPIALNFFVEPDYPYNVVAKVSDTTQTLLFFGAKLTLWGNPASPAHDEVRGHCLQIFGPSDDEPFPPSGKDCPSGAAEKAFITLPSNCSPLSASYSATAWQDVPSISGSIGAPTLTGCERLGFSPTIAAQPTTKAAQSPTGLDFSLDVHDEGLSNPEGLAQSDVRKVEVTLPEGFTTNPSLAESLVTCSESDLERETPDSEAGAGCPNGSKIGTVEVESPLLDESVNGALFVAEPYENLAGNSLLGLYMVVRNPNLGIVIKQPLRVEPDPVTGRLTTIAEEVPQLPFSHFRLHFREGTRSPLASPALCGEYGAKAVLTPWSGTRPVTTTSMFSIISGPGSGPCSEGGAPPFHPALEAGTVNNAAGSYSPFYVHLTRRDGEQEITHFSIKLPPGVIGKLAGIPYCSDAAIAAATARTGPHGGAEEIESPSCPAASGVGHTLVGAGVGPSLAYAPGKMYLAGPYHGSQLSLVAITAAKVGPFDLGTVVVRFAIRINPETAEVFVDAAGSDPLPHIIKGIPVHLRDIRAYVDRPSFVLNPTSCERTSTASTVLGSGTDFASEADDQPITVTSPFQAASCASLGFAPKVRLALKGGTKRNQNPALTAVVTPNAGDANIGYARVTLPHSEFLDNAHIKTVCTRVQFNAGGGNGEQCPADSVYGRAEAVTPLLDQPLSGPVFLRSSSHKLPDLVAALHGQQINIDLDGKIDSPKGGRIRTTFEAVPDAPVTKFTLAMFGGKKSLLVNSTNLCKGTHKAIAEFKGQNGKPDHFEPSLQTKCGKGAKGKKPAKKSGKPKRILAAYLGRAGW